MTEDEELDAMQRAYDRWKDQQEQEIPDDND